MSLSMKIEKKKRENRKNEDTNTKDEVKYLKIKYAQNIFLKKKKVKKKGIMCCRFCFNIKCKQFQTRYVFLGRVPTSRAYQKRIEAQM